MKRSISVALVMILLLCVFSSCAGGGTGAGTSAVFSPEASSGVTSAGTSSLPDGSTASPGASAGTGQESTSPAEASGGNKLIVRFLDVGQADAVLLSMGRHHMLIDGGNAADSSLVASVLKKLDITKLDYVVCTHAHEDHVGGLSGALSVCKAGVVYAPKTGSDSKAYTNFLKKVKAQGLTLTHPSPGDSFRLGDAVCTVKAPYTESADDLNNTSIVLRVVYKKTAFLFTGDMSREEETELLEHGENITCDCLKVGHHGSETSTGYRLLREASPKYAVISVGKGNSYSHPHEQTLSRLRDAGVTVYRTDLSGDIVAVSDGKTLTFTTGKTAASETGTENRSSEGTKGTTAAAEVMYIGNLNSKKFHRQDCRSLPKEENRVLFSTRSAAVREGYSPCKICNP